MIIKELPCGVRMVMERIPYLNSVTMGIWVAAGAVDEDDKFAGISHFTEHMTFKGTEKRSARDIANEVESLGAQANAFTGKEHTCYYVKSISSNLEAAADILIDIVMNSKYAKDEMDRERMVIGEEIKMYQDAPDELAVDAATDLVFAGSSLKNSILGSFASLKRINTAAMRDYVKANYTAGRMVVSIAGNFDEKKAFKIFSEKLNVSKGAPRKKQALAPYSPTHKSIVKEIEQTHLCLGRRSIPITHEDYYAYVIMANALGGGMSSRLFQSIREEKGLAYSVFAANSTNLKSGVFYIYAGVAHEKLKDAVHGIADELSKLKREGLREEELETSRAQIKSAYAFSQESTTARMILNGRDLISKGEILSDKEVIRRYDAVKLSDVNRVARKICDLTSYSAAVVSNRRINVKKLMSE